MLGTHGKNCDQPRPITEIWLAKAPSYKGPYEIVGDEPVTNTSSAEDPGIWRDHRGNFHAIFHGPGHAWSEDGITWGYLPDTPGSDRSGQGGCYNGTLKHKNGSVEVLHDAERPKVWVNASTGLPELLFFSSGGSDQPTAKDGTPIISSLCHSVIYPTRRCVVARRSGSGFYGRAEDPHGQAVRRGRNAGGMRRRAGVA